MSETSQQEPLASAVRQRTTGTSAQPSTQETVVVVGTSALAAQDSSLVQRIAALVNDAYGYRRLSDLDVRSRVAMGDSGTCANRVLHLAFSGNELVGCCSSTIQPPFTCCGCGHWGLMAVAPSAQGKGVASALAAAAEQRLAQAGCVLIQIEYEYTGGSEFSERLRQWYEGRLGFRCLTGAPDMTTGHRQFRVCHKFLRPTGCSHCCHLCVVS